MFGYNGKEDGRIKIYDLIHPEDLSYVAQGHKEGRFKTAINSFYYRIRPLINNSEFIEVLKQGSIGLLSHRWLSNTGSWIWLQSRLRIVYKDNKADHIIAIHRKLE